MKRRLLAGLSVGVALAAVGCSAAQQGQVTATTAQVVAWLQQSETALQTLIAVSVPQAAQSAAEAALAAFTKAASDVGSAISQAAPITTVGTGAALAAQLLLKAIDVFDPLLGDTGQAVLDALAITAGLLSSFGSSVTGVPPAVSTPSARARIARAKSTVPLTTIVP